MNRNICVEKRCGRGTAVVSVNLPDRALPSSTKTVVSAGFNGLTMLVLLPTVDLGHNAHGCSSYTRLYTASHHRSTEHISSFHGQPSNLLLSMCIILQKINSSGVTPTIIIIITGGDSKQRFMRSFVSNFEHHEKDSNSGRKRQAIKERDPWSVQYTVLPHPQDPARSDFPRTYRALQYWS